MVTVPALGAIHVRTESAFAAGCCDVMLMILLGAGGAYQYAVGWDASTGWYAIPA